MRTFYRENYFLLSNKNIYLENVGEDFSGNFIDFLTSNFRYVKNEVGQIKSELLLLFFWINLNAFYYSLFVLPKRDLDTVFLIFLSHLRVSNKKLNNFNIYYFTQHHYCREFLFYVCLHMIHVYDSINSQFYSIKWISCTYLIDVNIY